LDATRFIQHGYSDSSIQRLAVNFVLANYCIPGMQRLAHAILRIPRTQQLAANAIIVPGNVWLPMDSYCSIQQIGRSAFNLLSSDQQLKNSSGLSRAVKGLMASQGTSTFRTTPVTARIPAISPQAPKISVHKPSKI